MCVEDARFVLAGPGRDSRTLVRDRLGRLAQGRLESRELGDGVGRNVVGNLERRCVESAHLADGDAGRGS